MDFSHRSRPQFSPVSGSHLALCATLAGLLLASLFFSGCSSHPQQLSATEPMAPGDICNYQWILHGINVDGREQKSRLFWQKMVRDRPYLTCDKLGFVRGNAGSNPYLGKFDLADDGSIEWIKAPKISRMVGRKDSSELEKDFLKALPRIDRASVAGDILTLQGGEGTRIEFKQTGELPSSSP